MVESTGLENRHTLIAYLGFKSLSLRHYTESLQRNLQAFVVSGDWKLLEIHINFTNLDSKRTLTIARLISFKWPVLKCSDYS